MKTKYYAQGFTLIELAMVLFIMGLLLSSFLAPLAARVEQRERDETEIQLEEIKDVLFGYVIPYCLIPSHVLVPVLLEGVFREHVKKRGISIFVQDDGRWNACAASFRIPNPASSIGLVNVDGCVHGLAIEIRDFVRLEVDLDVVEVVLPSVRDGSLVSRVVESFWVV